MDEFRKKFPIWFQQMLEIKGLSQTEFGERMKPKKLERSAVNNWVKGRNIPSPKHRRAIFKIFGFSHERGRQEVLAVVSEQTTQK